MTSSRVGNVQSQAVESLIFALSLAALQRTVRDDRVATLALAPYTVWVLVYDIPWSYRLWRLNPS